MRRDADGSTAGRLPHARERTVGWAEAWARTGRFLLLLDFDGTLAPIVDRPEAAALPPKTRRVLQRLMKAPGLDVAIVSGRGMEDARSRAGIPGVPYAGNHGMEIDGGGVSRIHPEAAAARPALDSVRQRLERELEAVAGTLVEDKGLTLSIHYRLAARDRVDEIRRAVHAAADEAAGVLRVTAGKEVLEVRPDVEWDKGRAVEFLLDHFAPEPGVPVLYIGDDTTDEDAFRALRRRGAGEGVVVADPPPADTAASAYVRDPGEVAELFTDLATRAPG